METALVAIASLNAAKYNPRTISPEQLVALQRSLESFGFVQPVVVNKRGNVIVGGHQRVTAWKALGKKSVPVVYVELDPTQEKQLNLALNRISGEWDESLLVSLLGELQESGADIELTGFTAADLEAFDSLGGIDSSFAPDFPDNEPDRTRDDELPPAPRAITQPGDFYEIGRHRLYCGDSLKPGELFRVFGDIDPSRTAVITDPPYGITKRIVNDANACGGSTTKGGKTIKANSYGPIVGDDSIETAVKAFELCESIGFPVMLLWGANYYASHLPDSRCWIVWDKKCREWEDQFSDCELAWTNLDKPLKVFRHTFMGMVQDGEREKRVHPTQKPARMLEKVVEYIAHDSYYLLDLFGGSGGLLVAAERMNKSCLMVEIVPGYCDTIVARMRELFPELPVTRNGEPV